MIQLLSGPYVIVVTGRKFVCKFLGHYIWRVSGTEMLACCPNSPTLSLQQRADEERYLALLKSFLDTDSLYFSSTYDLTRSVQRQVLGEHPGEVLSGRVDLRFVVNRFITEPFLQVLQTRTDTRLEDFLIFCVEGFIEFQSLTIHQKKITFGLISRRATGRVGTRYHSRGIDDKGNVSNFVETEQILQVDDDLCSFVQVRGSIPLFWRQNINIKYKPAFEFYNSSSTLAVFEAHFRDLVQRYGRVMALNLVNQKGWEGELARMFAKQAREFGDPAMQYIAFDFNKECPRMQWNRVQNLLDRIADDLTQQAYFEGKLSTPQETTRLLFALVNAKQLGVVRTNCIDCLDRTNLVQGYLGRTVLAEQLRHNRVFSPTELVTDSPSLDAIFKKSIRVKSFFLTLSYLVWADNGDAISKQYSGTGALKADFTRTGKRTLRGALADGLNSVIRYVLNNFSDGTRQDAMDLFYGHYTVQLENYYSPFIVQFDQQLWFAPIIMLFSLIVSFYLFTFHGLYRFSALLLASIAFGFAFYLVLSNGIHYVQYPKLRPPPVVAHARPWLRGLNGQKRRLLAAIDPSRKVHVI